MIVTHAHPDDFVGAKTFGDIPIPVPIPSVSVSLVWSFDLGPDW
jgi:hypothetical protein